MKKILFVILFLTGWHQASAQTFWNVDVTDTVTPLTEWNQLLSTSRYKQEIKGEIVQGVVFDSNDNSFMFTSDFPKNHIFEKMTLHIYNQIGNPTSYYFNYPKYLNDDEELLNIYIEMEGGSKTMIWKNDDFKYYLIWEGTDIIFSVTPT